MVRTFSAILLLNLCFLTCISAGTKDEAGISRLHDNLVKNLLSGRRSSERSAEFLSRLNEDGSFSDINYEDKTRGSWQTSSHLSRLLSMAVMYKSPQSVYYNNPETKKQVFKILDYWLNNDFSNPNWWWPEIGVPLILEQAMILLQDELSPEELQVGLKILNRGAAIKNTGQNKVWLSGNVVYVGLLTHNIELIKKAANSIADEIVITEYEGIQPDFSFHQHGHQLQFGNYGLAFAGDMLKWASILEGTEFAFDPGKIEILRNYLRNGLRWVVWNKHFDLNACGRQLFQNVQVSKARAVEGIFQKAQTVDHEYAKSYNTDLESFDGNTHFWRSDMTVHRRSGFYASVKMSSKRVIGYEVVDSENIQGYHMGDGATIFYQSGDEYQEIFPFWDWKKIPGITAFQDQEKLPQTNGLLNRSDFVGGVSDGMNGIAVLNYNRDSLSANKSWFFFNDAIISLGIGIKSTLDKDVATTINQSLLKDEVQVSSDGKISTIPKGLHDLKKVNWVIHDKWGYYFPGTPELKLENQQRKGAWSRVVAPMSTAEMMNEIFQLWFDHGNKPSDASYAYYVFPSATQENIQKRAKEIKIIANNKDFQAVSSKDGKLSGVVFYRQDTCQLNPGRKLSAYSPCLVLISSDNNKTQLSVSDPTHLQKVIKLSLQGKYSSMGPAVTSYDAGKKSTTFVVQLPDKGDAGKSVIFNIQK